MDISEIKMILKDELKALYTTAKNIETMVHMIKKEVVKNDINYQNDCKGCFEILEDYLGEMITRTDDLNNLKERI